MRPWIHGLSVASQSDCMRSILQHHPPTQLHLLKYVPFSSTGQKQLMQFLKKTSVFFFKAHIMAGQVRPGKSVTDFAWLTKKEISKRVDGQYWGGVKDMLSDF